MKPKRRNDFPPMSPCKNRRSHSLLPTASATPYDCKSRYLLWTQAPGIYTEYKTTAFAASAP